MSVGAHRRDGVAWRQTQEGAEGREATDRSGVASGVPGAPLLETLERRLLLSGALVSVSLTPSQRDAIVAGLNELGSVATLLDAYGALATNLPVVGHSLAGVLDLGAALTQGLHDPVAASAFGTGGAPTSDDLVSALTGLSLPLSTGGTASVTGTVTGGENAAANRVEFTLDLQATSQLTGLALDLGAQAQSLGISLDAAATADLTATLDYAFTFGYDLTSSQFFVSGDGLTLGATASFPNLNVGATVAGQSLTIQNGSASLTGQVRAQFAPSLTQDGEVTGAELSAITAGNLGQNVALTPTGGLQARLPLNAALTGFGTFGLPTITVREADVFSGQAPDVGLNVDLSSVESALLAGLQQVDSVGSSLSGVAALQQRLPVLSKSLDDLLNVGSLFTLHDQVQQVFTSHGSATTAGDVIDVIRSALLDVIGNSAQGSLSEGPLSITGGLFPQAGSGGEVRVDLALNAGVSKSLPWDFSADTAASVLHIDSSATLSAQVSASVAWSVGIDLASGGFFLRVTQDPTVSATVAASDINVNLNLGFVHAAITGGSVALAPSVTVPITDPTTAAGDLGITSADFADVSKLLGTPQATGTANVNLPISASLGSFTTGQAVVSTAGSVNLFGGGPVLTVDLKNLADFSHFGPSDVLAMLKELANSLQSVSGSSLLQLPLPFAPGQTLGSAADFSGLFLDKLGGLLSQVKTYQVQVPDGQGGTTTQTKSIDVPLFSSAQDLSAIFQQVLPAGFPTTTVDAQYDLASHALTFHIVLTDALPTVQVPLGFNYDLSPLGSISTGTTLALDASGTLDFTLGIVLTQLGAGFTLTGATLLTDLNGNSAGNMDVPLQRATSGADLRLTRHDGVSFTVDLASATTVQDVLDAINNNAGNTADAGGHKVTASIDAERGALDLVDPTAGAMPFAVTQLNGSQLGAYLGLLNPESKSRDAATPNTGTISGAGLSGDSFAKHLFLQDAALTGAASLSATDLTAGARFGFINILVGGGAANVAVQAQLALEKQGAPGGPGAATVTLHDLAHGLTTNPGGLFTVGVTGSGAVQLTNIQVTSNILGTLASVPEIDVTLPTISASSDLTNLNAGSLKPSLDLSKVPDQLLRFGHLSFGAIISGLNGVTQYLSSLADAQANNFPLLNDKLPLVNKSIDDFLGYAAQFTSFVNTLTQNPAQALQEVQGKINSALAGDPGNPQVTVGLDPADSTVLKLGLSFTPLAYQQQFPLNLDLQSLLALAGSVPAGLAGLTSFLGVSASANLVVTATTTLQLNLGVDLTDPAHPKAFLYDSTGLDLTAGVSGSDMSFSASLGPLSLDIDHGTANLTGTFHAGLNTGQRYYLDNTFFSQLKQNVSVHLDGSASVSLPVSRLSDQPFTITIPSLVDLLRKTPGSITFGDINIKQFFSFPDPIQLLSQPTLVIDGLDSALGILQNVMDGQIGGVKLPLIGDHLQAGASVVQSFRDTLENQVRPVLAAAGDLRNLVKHELFVVFSTDLGLLGDTNGDGQIDENDVTVTEGADNVEFDMLLHKDLAPLSPVPFDLGVPAIGLNISGSVDPKLSWDFHFGFGLSTQDGLYLVVPKKDGGNTPPIMSLGLNVTIPGFQASGNLVFLSLSAQDMSVAKPSHVSTGASDPDNPSAFTGSFNVTVNDPNNDGRLTLTDLRAGSLSQMLDVGLNASAYVNLLLKAEIGSGGNFPNISAELHLAWNFAASVHDGFSTEAPHVWFAHTELDLGSFFSNVLGPIIDKIQTYTQPLGGILDFLNKRIPVISDLRGQDTTVLDLASLIPDPRVQKSVAAARTFISVLDTFNQIAGDLTANKDGDIVIPFDDLDLSQLAGDLRQLKDLKNVSLSGLSGQATDYNGLLSKLPGGATGSRKLISDMASVKGGGATIGTGAFKFPLLTDPSSIFGLLMGQTVDLFEYDFPQFNFEFFFKQEFRLFGVITFDLYGDFSAQINLGLGFDSLGLQEFKDSGWKNWTAIFDGFYIKDFNPDGNGTPLATLKATIGVEGGVDVGVASAGVGGRITGTVHFNLDDSDHDGKMRWKEVYTHLFNQQTGAFQPWCIFKIDGSLDWDFYAYADALFGLWHDEWSIASGTLLSFSSSCPELPVLATDEGGGVYRLNMGPNAGDRINGDLTDGNEHFTVRPSSDGVSGDYVVTWLDTGDTQTITGATKIVADGGAGDDTIDLSGTNLACELSGGDGNDTLLAGNGDAILHGGTGNDILTGGAGHNQLYGDAGNDTLTGDSSDTFVFADGWGADTVTEPAGGQATLDFNAVTAPLQANVGTQSVQDNAGDTVTWTGPIATLAGGPGSNTLIGGNGANLWTITGANAGNLGGVAYTAFANLLGGSGADTFTFLNGALESGTVDGGPGSGVNLLDFVAYQSPLTFTISSNNGGRLDTQVAGSMAFARIDAVTGGAADDHFNFRYSRGVDGKVDGGAGYNTFDWTIFNLGQSVQVNRQMASATGTGSYIRIAQFLAGDGIDTLTGLAATSTWYILAKNQGHIGPTTGQPDSFDFVGFENLIGNGGSDTFVLSDGAYVTGMVDGGPGANTTLDASPYTTDNQWIITAPNQGTLNPAGNATDFRRIANLTGGQAQDHFTFQDGQGVSGLVDGQGGYDTLDWSAYSAANPVTVNREEQTATGTGGYASIEQVLGGAGNNTLIGADQNSVWRITGNNAGTIDPPDADGGFDFAAFQNLVGGAGNDRFAFADGKHVDGTIDGGGGVNTLDWSAYSTAARADLVRAWATGVDGGNDNAIANIQNLTGGAGRDVFTGDSHDNVLIGNGGNDILTGGGGGDTLDGGPGDNSLTGGAGNDAFILWASGHDIVIDPGGVNTIDYSHAANGITLDLRQYLGTAQFLDNKGDTLQLAGVMANAVGSAYDDRITGVVSGVLHGGAGNDVLVAAPFDSTLYGDDGNDTLYASAGRTTLDGGAGDDKLYAGSGETRLVGGPGADTLTGGPAPGVTWADYSTAPAAVQVDLGAGTASDGYGTTDKLVNVLNVIGSAFADTILGNAQANRLQGGPGADTITGGGGNDTFLWNSGDGNDTLDGSGGALVTLQLTGDPGAADSVAVAGLPGTGRPKTLALVGTKPPKTGSAANHVQVTAGSANTPAAALDVLGVQQVQITTGGGDDTVTVGDLTGTDVTAVAANLGAGNDTLDASATNVPVNADGGPGNDYLKGGRGNDVLRGGPGNDTFIGGPGNDVLIGGPAGTGTETVDYSGAPAGVVVNLGAGAAFDGTGGVDTIIGVASAIGSAFNDTLIGGSLDGVLDGGVGDDKLYGGSGRTTLLGGTGADTLFGGAGETRLIGGPGADTLYGGPGLTWADYSAAPAAVQVDLGAGTAADGLGTTDKLVNVLNVIGSAFADNLVGSAAPNQMQGGPGDDTIRSLGGNDTIIWNSGDGNDTLDAGDGYDRLLVNGAPAQGSAIAVTSTPAPVGAPARPGHTGSGPAAHVQVSGAALAPAPDFAPGLALAPAFSSAGNFTLDVVGVEDATLNTGGGNDAVTIGDLTNTDALIVRVKLGAGNDTLDASATNVPVTADGGAGNDRLVGGRGNDVLNGGPGDDTLIGGPGSDALIGGPVGTGSDTADYSSDPAGVNVNLIAGVAWDGAGGIDTLRNIQNALGSAFNDVLVGGSQTGVLDGGAGDDQLAGVASQTRLIGGPGHDTLASPPQTSWADYSTAPAAVAVDLAAGTASDGYGTTDKLAGVENVIGSAFNDVLAGNAQANRLQGGPGADTLRGGGGVDTVIWNPGDGNDAIDGSGGLMTVQASGAPFAANTIMVSALPGTGAPRPGPVHPPKTRGLGDHVQIAISTGGADPATLDLKGVLQVQITTGGGNDTVTIGDLTGTDAAAISVSLGAGNDTLDASATSAPITADGGAGDDILRGGQANDTLNGGAGNDQLFGNAGNDTLNGGAGNDLLQGGAGNDTLNGGDPGTPGTPGTDTADYSDAPAAVAVSLQTGAASNDGYGGADRLLNIANLIGSAFADQLEGDNRDNVIWGGAGNDTIRGLRGNDTLHGGAGDDTMYAGDGVTQVYGDDGNDTLSGGAGPTLLDGGAGNDTLIAGPGDNVLDGRTGADTLLGGPGRDRLYGWTGADKITGGTGNQQLFGEDDNDALNAGPGRNYLDSGPGANTVDLRLGQNTYTPGSGQDTVLTNPSGKGGGKH